jgi:hypothetical protein
MTSIVRNYGTTQDTVWEMADCQNVEEITITPTITTAGGIGIVNVAWTEHTAVMGERFITVAAGDIDLNSGHIATPTTYYVYINGTTGAEVPTVSTTNPAIDATVDEYYTIAVVRMVSPAGTASIMWGRPLGQFGVYEAIHNLKENAEFSSPVWINGMAPTWSAGGKLSTDAGHMRYVGQEPVDVAAITEGAMALDDETTTATGLDAITTYADGSAITAGKYHKVLIGVKRGDPALLNTKYIVMRQGVPTVEYATEAEAQIDAENVAANGFGEASRFSVMPLGQFVLLKGDYTSGTFYDLRVSGLTGGAGGSGGSGDHGLLAGLGDDDHTQYLRTDGTRAVTADWDAGSFEIRAQTFESDVATGTAPLVVASTTLVTNLNADQLDGLHDTAFLKADGTIELTGNMTVKALTTIDGVDISVHAATADAHHDLVTLAASATGLMGLSTQEISLDNQTANYVFAGPASGAATTPTFRALTYADLPVRTDDSLVLVDGQNDNVALTDGVDEYTVTGPTAAFGISGFTGGYGGRTITIMNNGINKAMTAYHQTTSDAANQIICPGANTDASTSGYGLMVFRYYGTTQRWVLVSVIT